MSEHAEAQPIRPPVEGTSLLSSILQEVSDIWKRLPHKWLFVVTFAAWIALFHFLGNATIGYGKISSVFVWAHEMYSARENDSHGHFIPLAFLFFLWLKRKELAKIAPRIWWPAILYFAGAVFLHFFAYRIQQPRVSILAFTFGLHALIGLVWGREAMRRTVFPVFLLLFCIPFGVLAEPLTFKLRVFVTQVSVGIGHDILGIQVFREGSQIFGPNGRAMYDVAPACSGLRSLVAMGALAVVYSFLYLNSSWRRLVLIGSALPLALFANIVRITTVIIVGDAYGQKAGVMIENKFGFVTFAIAMIGMMVVGWLLTERKTEEAPKSEKVLEETPV